MPNHRQNRRKGDLRFRTLQTELLRSDDGRNEVEVSFSSEAPIERPGIGTEILAHNPESVDLTRLNTEGPVLFDHERHRVLGRVMRAWIDPVTRTGRAILRFGKSPLAVETYRNIRDGITRGISVGYTITQIVKRAGGIVAVKWSPHEISIAPVPYDVSVDVGRSYSQPPTTRIMKTQEQDNELKLLRRKESLRGIAQTLQRRGIDVPDAEVERAARSDVDDATFLRRHLEANAGPQGGADPYILDQRSHGSRNQEYSLTRALNLLSQSRPLDGLEGEVAQELSQKVGVQAKGVLIPLSILGQRAGAAHNQRSAMTAGNFASAGALTGIETGPMVEKLEVQSIAEEAGATTLNGLTATVSLPRQTKGSVAHWLSESATVDSSKLEFNDITLTPHRLSTMTAFSKQLLVQAVPDLENLIRRDLSLRIALGVDRAVFVGRGVEGEPRGIFNLSTATSGIKTMSFSGAPAWDSIVEMETKIAEANALRGRLAYVTSPSAVGVWKGTSVDAGSGVFLTQNGVTNGHPTLATNQMAETDFANRAVFGNFNDVVIGRFGELDVVVDPYSLSDQGRVRVVITQFCDIAIRHPESFCVSTDDANQ